MPVSPDVNGPKYWHQRAKEARRSAERMTDEKAKHTMVRRASPIRRSRHRRPQAGRDSERHRRRCRMVASTSS
jgi:hypothetical protein